MPPSLTIEELLLQHGLLTASQLERVVKQAQRQKKTVEQVIRDAELVYPEPLAQLKAESLGLPYVDLKSAQIDQQAMRGVSEKDAKTHQFVVFGEADNHFQVAMANPTDNQAYEAVNLVASKKKRQLDIYCASPESINWALTADDSATSDQPQQDFNQELADVADLPSDQKKLAAKLEEAPVNKVFAVIIRHALEGLASDVHIEPLADEVRVRYRIAGQLHTSLVLPRNIYVSLLSRAKILANLPVATPGIQTGHFSVTADQQSYNIRVGIIPTLVGEKITLHLVDTSQGSPSLAELGLSGHQREVVLQRLQYASGLVIITGPDGAGKSTTLFAILAALNHPNLNLASVEELIEHEIPGINQIQVDTKQGITYPPAINATLHQDIDVLMVEKITGATSAGLLIRGALAGHLILSTINTTSALTSIPHLLDLNTSPSMLGASLQLIVAQRLLPKLCQACLEEEVIPQRLRTKITAELKAMPKAYLKEANLPRRLTFFNSRGCPECQEKKTHGQTALFEILPVSPEFRSAVASSADLATLEKVASRHDFISLQQIGLLKALQGFVRYDDVLRLVS